MSRFEPIAIVGQACILPGAHTPDELWRAVVDRRDLLSRATEATWQVDDPRRLMRCDADAAPAERIPSNRGGYVTGFERVRRAGDYGLEPGLVQELDPLFQWLLHVGHEAFEHAGISPRDRANGGAIVGNLSYPTYALNDYAWSVWAEAAGLKPRSRPNALNRFMSGSPVELLAQSLGLTRGGFMVDAACASSLYAIGYACRWLQSRRADVMLAGGVARVHGLTIHAGFTTLQALSPSGQSRPLHAQADGLVPSEGAAIVVLKRLEDAERDGSRILGVIRAVGLANDGRGTGLLVPSADGQVRAMEAAYRASGLSPRDVDLVECHATGTLVGDSTEIASCARVFGADRRLALGSLKSNLGHLLPVAGVAGLIKVLKSMEHGVHGAFRHLDEPTAALEQTRFEPLRDNREWETRGVRRAAVNAFGFGGNNAHLLVEQHATGTKTASFARGPEAQPQRCAIVALALRAGEIDRGEEYAALAFDAPAREVAPAIDAIALPLEGSAFPPSDLEHALPQQLLALELAHRAVGQLRRLPAGNVSVFVGMGCDPNACRFGLLLRFEEFLRDHGVERPAAAAAAREIRGPVKRDGVAATTLGLMPNVVANRLNRQFGATGGSCAVSAEESSGLHALALAVDALQEGACDAAFVGAVELGADLVHALACEEIQRTGEQADGGCMLILKREADAVRDGDRILAFVAAQRESGGVAWQPYGDRIEAAAGVAHAARGLMQVAAAASALARPVFKGGCVAVAAGDRTFALSPPRANQPNQASPGRAAGPTLRFPAHSVPVADFVRETLEPAERMPAPPMRAAPRGSEVAIASVPDVNRLDVTPVDSGVDAIAASQPENTSDAVIRLHEIFLEEIAAAHEAFLHVSAGSTDVVEPPVSEVQTDLVQPADIDLRGYPETSDFVGHQASARLIDTDEPAQAIRQGQAKPVDGYPGGNGSNGELAVPASTVNDVSLPGPKFSREQLIELASGRISKLFGPEFASQDGFERQVRMPMPPMLLADRVTGIDAIPGVLGAGKIWTETDVRVDAWYLDVDRMPLGITIEAGQADLLLISWMGIDRFNRSDRIYRLLGCEATIKGPLPKIGDTLRFEISVDGHAELGPIRMMFFHSDLTVNGEVRLSVRHGQAGFFTDEELADSEGVLWDAAAAPLPALRATHSEPRWSVTPRAFSGADVRAFAEGRPADCFGSAWRRTRAHTRTPRIGSGRMQLFDEVTAFDPRGGPWQRGYLRTVMAVTPDRWFFGGHFKNDPCMPGTLMLEGAVQSMAFYLAAMGCTVDADGWRFEPPAGQTVTMRCRGQCVPTSRELVYEIYVEEFNDGAIPRLRATVMGSVDGLKAFFAEGLTLDLVPDWPLDAMLRRGEVRALTHASCWSLDGFSFDHRSLLGCALGRPSQAFGPGFLKFDGPTRIPRLPRPPYHFMSRITSCTARMGHPEPGVVAEADFDFQATDWYFLQNGASTMPASVLMEALLQPCGWLSSFVRDSSGQKEDIFFRNLDGTLIWQREIKPADGTLHVRTKLTRWSELGTMIIVAFDVEATMAGAAVARMETAFGFFPGDAFANQAGIAPSGRETETLGAAANCALVVSNDALPAGPRLAGAPLLMIDRITGWWPERGQAGLGIVRGEKDVDPGEWFFNAHFMQDPVQPGSLGIEALLQLLQCAIRLAGIGRELSRPVFEPVAMGEPLTWKYRGQVVPENGKITTMVEVLERVNEPDRAVLVRARGSLWIDGKKIYETPKLAMRVGEGAEQMAESLEQRNGARSREVAFSLSTHPWLDDHRPSFTRSVMPLTVLIDELAVTVQRASARNITRIEAFFPARWVVCPEEGTTRIRTQVSQVEANTWMAELAHWRDARSEGLSRFDVLATTRVHVADAFAAGPRPLAPLSAPVIESPYATHETTHGPAFQLLREVRRSAAGASAVIDAAAGGVPWSLLHPALLDACTHIVPFSRLAEWYPEIPLQHNALPRGIRWLNVHGPAPHGIVRCEVRPRGLDSMTGMPIAYAQFIVGETVWCELEMEFALLDAAPFQHASFADRRAFIRREATEPAVRFSRNEQGTAVIRLSELARWQWMPHQLEAMFALPPAANLGELAEDIAARELIAHEIGVHPSRVSVSEGVATAAELPIQAVPVSSRRGEDEVRVAGGLASLRAPVGDTFFSGPFLADLLQAVVRRFVRYFRLVSPERSSVVRGQPVILCSNHQTALESLLFTDLYMRWSGLPLTTVTRVEHERSWVGQVTDLLWRYPGRTVSLHPQMLFDRDRPDSFFDLISRFKAAQRGEPHVLHLHVEGEQARRAGQPVGRMTSAIVDLALETGLPIVPVKFSGGLPAENVDAIVSFPFEYGRQDYTVGAPITPAELEGMPRPRAAERVVSAINALPPSAADERWLTNPAEFVAAVQQCRERHRLSEVQAAVIVALRELPELSAVTRAILDFPEQPRLPVAPAERAWHEEFARWLWRDDAAWQRDLEAWKTTAKA